MVQETRHLVLPDVFPVMGSGLHRFPAAEIDFQLSGDPGVRYLYGLCVLRLGVFRLIAGTEENSGRQTV